MSPKNELVTRIRESLEKRLARLRLAAAETHAAATDPDSKAESKYDTRSLEASYLASGQARQIEDTLDALQTFSQLELPDFEIDQQIAAGALVEVDLHDESEWFLLVPAAGGLSVSDGEREITLLSPESALYRKLLGLAVGDQLEDPPLLVTELS